ncbi:MgtC/SapB family protein [Clostridium sediminicola]|uniref:MgtC/SapB family protein n=1 Tax=Clostridium sediminicola TaxID=3114879 RepID=UPI0031F26FA5
MLYYEVIIRLTLAVLIGGIVGYEREFKNRPAGFRTHILVCVGAAVVSMIQLYDVEVTMNKVLQNPELAGVLKADMGRLGAQVITGVGFLGAGTIIRDKGSVKGLTTAASLWAVACVGLAVGLGYYFLSVVATLGVFIVLVSLKRVETKLLGKGKIVKLEIHYFDKSFIANSEAYFEKYNIKIKKIEFLLDDEEKNEEQEYKKSLYTILIPRAIKDSNIIQNLVKIDGIYKVKLL